MAPTKPHAPGKDCRLCRVGEEIGFDLRQDRWFSGLLVEPEEMRPFEVTNNQLDVILRGQGTAIILWIRIE